MSQKMGKEQKCENSFRIRKFALQSLSSSVHSNDLMAELGVTLRVAPRQVINFHSQHYPFLKIVQSTMY